MSFNKYTNQASHEHYTFGQFAHEPNNNRQNDGKKQQHTVEIRLIKIVQQHQLSNDRYKRHSCIYCGKHLNCYITFKSKQITIHSFTYRYINGYNEQYIIFATKWVTLNVDAWVGAAVGLIHVEIMRDFVLSALTTIENRRWNKTKEKTRKSRVKLMHGARSKTYNSSREHIEMNAIWWLWGFLHSIFWNVHKWIKFDVQVQILIDRSKSMVIILGW